LAAGTSRKKDIPSQVIASSVTELGDFAPFATSFFAKIE